MASEKSGAMGRRKNRGQGFPSNLYNIIEIIFWVVM